MMVEDEWKTTSVRVRQVKGLFFGSQFFCGIPLLSQSVGFLGG